MYVSSRAQEQLKQPIWGWLGRRDPFEMEPGYVPAEGIQGFLSGTPPVLGLVAVDEGIAVVAEAGIDPIRSKGIRLTEFAIALADERLAPLGVTVASPRDADRRAHRSHLRTRRQRPCARACSPAG